MASMGAGAVPIVAVAVTFRSALTAGATVHTAGCAFREPLVLGIAGQSALISLRSEARRLTGVYQIARVLAVARV